MLNGTEPPMISVVMPTYNSRDFVADAVGSILDQTLRTLELIIVDDGSTDDTVRIVSHYANRDPRIRLISSAHGGASSARNIGIACAKYKWIALMDADDISLPRRLEIQLAAALQYPNVIAWGTFALLINSKREVLGVSRTGATSKREFEQNRNTGRFPMIITATALLRKDILMQIGPYDPTFDPTEDLELFERLSAVGPLLAIAEPLYLRRIHKSNVTTQRFLLHRTQARYVKARNAARTRGLPLPALQDFVAECSHQPFSRRIRRRLDDLSQYYYRLSAVEYAERNYCKWLIDAALSVSLYPNYAISRAWRQRISPEAHQWMIRHCFEI